MRCWLCTTDIPPWDSPIIYPNPANSLENLVHFDCYEANQTAKAQGSIAANGGMPMGPPVWDPFGPQVGVDLDEIARKMDAKIREQILADHREKTPGPCTCDTTVLMTRGCPSAKGGKCPNARFSRNK